MTSTAEILLAFFLLTNIVLAGTGRLRQAIRLVAIQGWMVGLLPILLWNWTDPGAPGFRVWAVAFVNGAVKGVALPILLRYAADRAKANFELEPLVGFRLSQVIAFAIASASFAIGKALHIHETVASELAIPRARLRPRHRNLPDQPHVLVHRHGQAERAWRRAPDAQAWVKGLGS